MPTANGSLHVPSGRRQALLWEATSDYLESLSHEVAEAGYGAAIVHWFDDEILAALRESASPSDRLSAVKPAADHAALLYGELREAPFVDEYSERGHAFHSLTRRIVLDRLWQDRPDFFRAVSANAARYHGRDFESGVEADWDDVLEYAYHLLVVDEEQGVALTRSLVDFMVETADVGRLHALVALAEEHSEAGRLSPQGCSHVRLWRARAALAAARTEEAARIADELLALDDDVATPDVKSQAGEIASKPLRVPPGAAETQPGGGVSLATRRSPGSRGSARSMAGGVERYSGPGERLIYACRRHPIVLRVPLTVWFVSLALFLYLVAARSQTDGVLRAIAGALVAGASGFLAWKAVGWWRRRYALTDVRVLLVEGVLTRRVRGLPLKLVIDATYHRSLGGRLFGYGDLELNLSGQPGLRKLATLRRPDVMYRWIVSLIGDRDVSFEAAD